MDRREKVRQRIQDWVEDFPDYVASFSRSPAFTREGQLELHQETIALRRELGSARAAVTHPDFQRLLWETLQVWGIGRRASRLKPFGHFSTRLEALVPDLDDLEDLRIDDPRLDVVAVARGVWECFAALDIVDNKNVVVPHSMALHHILPDLVMPINRKFTQAFFGLHNPEFQYRQRSVVFRVFVTFARTAHFVRPARFVGHGWNTSRTKVMDNALVGYCLRHDL